jgi:DNA-directed RNA polymerase specialized sigma subunit
MNMKEIAEALVITPMSVSRKMKSALNIISKFVAEKEGSLVISDNNDK